MKKVVLVVLVFVMLASAVDTVKAENPPAKENPFAAEYAVQEFNYNKPYFFIPTKPHASAFFDGRGNMWIIMDMLNKDKKLNGYFAEINSATGKVENIFPIKDNFYIDSVYKGAGIVYLHTSRIVKEEKIGSYTFTNRVNGILAFDLKEGRVAWTKVFRDGESVRTLVPVNNGVVCYSYSDTSFKNNERKYKMLYFDKAGNLVFKKTNQNCYYFVGYNPTTDTIYSATDNSVTDVNKDSCGILQQETITALSFKDKTTKAFILNLKGSKKFWCWLGSNNYAPDVSDNTRNLCTSSLPLGQNIPKADTTVFFGNVVFSDNECSLDDLKEIQAVPPDVDSDNPFGIVFPPIFEGFYDFVMFKNYTVYMDEATKHLKSQRMFVFDAHNNLLWQRTVKEYINGDSKIISENTPVLYKNTLVYGNGGKIELANINTGAVVASFPVSLRGYKKCVIVPLGEDGDNAYVGINYFKKDDDGNLLVDSASIVKISYKTSTLTVNSSSLPGINYTISKDGKTFTWQTGKPINLFPGKYTISLPDPITPNLAAPEPVEVDLQNGDNKTITMNYLHVYTIKLQIGSNTFTVNGEQRTLDSPPVIKNNRTLVPIRAIVEALGGTVQWNPKNKEVDVQLGDKTVSLWIGKNQAKAGWMFVPIDKDPKVVPEIINSRTMLPLRFVVENLGCTVDWDPSTKTITITYKG